MELDPVLDLVVHERDDVERPLRELVRGRTALILVGPLSPGRLERTLIEIAGLTERLPPEVEPIVVWPARCDGDVAALPLPASVRIVRVVDGRGTGEAGQRLTVLLVDLERGSRDPYAIDRPRTGAGRAEGARQDRTIDLGDMQL